MTAMFDMARLRPVGPLRQLAPEAMTGFKALDEAALAESAVSKNYKELMAIAVALRTQRPYCPEVHRKAAIAEAEPAETVFVATALRRCRAHLRYAPVAGLT